jgi:quinoprotein glucose dehydrogenase
MRKITRRLALALPILSYLASKTQALAQAAGAPLKPAPANTDWLHYAGDLAGTRYSPLDQIGPGNFKDMEVAWRFATSPYGPQPEYILGCTPLVSKGRMFLTAGSRRSVVSIDAATGEVLWVHREDEGERAARAARRGSGRGLSYWTDGKEERILYVTIGYQLVALDAKTGARCPGFGDNGIVDLRLNDDQEVDLIKGDFGYNAAPAIGNDVVVIGAAMSPGDQPRTHNNVKGYVRGFDVRTGKRLWIFHTIPKKGEFGYDTWLNGSADVNGNTGVWGQIAIDEELNTAYLGVEMPTGDYNGQYRPGPGLFGESIVAVDLKTGVRKWHYQFVHHGLWDFDPPCAAILADVPINGKVVKVLAQPSKQGFLYVFNRVTGKPIWPIVEKKVAKGDVPGEWYAPTQPFPSKPPAYDLQGIGPKDLIDFTPALHAEALRLIKNYVTGPIYTPPTVYKRDGTWGTIQVPNQQGGTNWPGGAYDPETRTVYVYSKTVPTIRAALHNTNKAVSDMEWISMVAVPKEDQTLVRDGFKPRDLTVQGLPLLKPPYGRLTAINLSKGDIAWQVAHGETPDQIRNHPALKGVKIPRTGQSGLLGPLVTKTMLVCGDAMSTTAPSGERGAMLRAYDKKTGEEKGAVMMPGPQVGAPMTYMLNGSQYIVLSIGGGNVKAELIAFRLPRASSGPARPPQAGD